MKPEKDRLSLYETCGDAYRLRALSSFQKRLRWYLAAPERRPPTVSLVTCKDGTKYKLLTGAPKNPDKIKNIRVLSDELSSLACVPRIIKSCSQRLLVEYVDGELPRIQDRNFAQKFGYCLAELHSKNTQKLDVELLEKKWTGCLRKLIHLDFLPLDKVARIESMARHITPQHVYQGLVCSDLKIQNFVVTPDGNLVLIDIGSIKRDQAIDVYLFESEIYRNMNQAEFKRSYLEAGGGSYLFDHKDYLLFLNSLIVGAYWASALGQARRYDWSRRRMARSFVGQRMKCIDNLVQRYN